MSKFFQVYFLSLLIPIICYSQDTVRNYYDDGNIKKEIVTLKNGLQKIQTYFEDGTLSEKYYQKDGKFRIVYKSYYLGGRLSCIKQYINGIQDGLEVNFFDTDSASNLSKLHILYKTEIGALLDSDDCCGAVSSIGRYRHNVLDGITRLYDEYGNMVQLNNYANGKQEGVAKYWDENGRLLSTENYKAGEIDGMQTYYGENRGDRQESMYRKGKAHGVDKMYQNNRLIRECNYLNNELDGLFREYYENGEIKFIDTYKKGKKINRKMFDENGRQVFNQDYP